MISFSFQHDLRDIDLETSMELQKRSALGLELTTMKRREYFEYQPGVERDVGKVAVAVVAIKVVGLAIIGDKEIE